MILSQCDGNKEVGHLIHTEAGKMNRGRTGLTRRDGSKSDIRGLAYFLSDHVMSFAWLG